MIKSVWLSLPETLTKQPRKKNTQKCEWKKIERKNLFVMRYLKMVEEIDPLNSSQMHSNGI